MIHSVLIVIHISYSRFYKCQISSLYFIQIIIIRNIVKYLLRRDLVTFYVFYL